MHARTSLALAVSALALLACGDPTSTAGRSVPPASPHAPMESPAPAETGWITLFDGTDPAAQWRGFRQAEFPSGWEVRDGCLVHVGPGGGDIVTRRAFGSFELELDWKVTPGGNSGIFYHVSEDMPNTWETGPEMQILDDGTHQDGKDRLTCAGADYALYPAPLGAVKPVGQWNRARILVEGMHVRYWLNGVKTADFVRGSDDWKARVAASKFSRMPGYARNARGHIALQDHGDEVWFRNIRVRPLD